MLLCVIGLAALLGFLPIAGADDSAPLTGNHPVEAESLRQTGAASPNLALQMQLRFALRHPKALAKLLAEQQNPGSPDYHKWLSSDEFRRRFGASASELNAVEKWLQDQGFSVTRRSDGALEFNGSVAAAERAFATRIATFGDGEVYANTSDPIIPRKFANIVGSIRGLDNMVHAVPAAHPTRLFSDPGSEIGKLFSSAEPPLQLAMTASSSSGGGPVPAVTIGGERAFGPSDLRTFYDETVGPGADGTGSCIAIVDISDFLAATMTTFDNQFGLPAINYTRVLDGSNPGIIGTEQAESELDLQWAHASAPGASLRFHLGGDLVTDISDAITENLCGAISISYAFCGVSSSFMTATMDPLFQRAAAQGQSVFISSGDWGAAGLALNSAGTACVQSSSKSINEMAADPNVTAVGGTEFSPTYSGGNDQGYATEQAWNDSSGATGGGESQIFAKPAFQTGPGVPNDGMRDIPDIALIASPGSPGVFWADDVGGNAQISCCIGGTSLSAPVWAGFAAVISEMVGNRLGNLNQIIYPLANTQYSSAGFHDVTSGNNNFNGVQGYSAGPSYDQVTGWGTIDFNLFANGVKNYLGSGPVATPTATPTARLTVTPTARPTATPTATPAATPTAAATTGITFVGSGPLTDSGTAVTSVSVGLPSGIATGDTLLAQIIVYDASASDVPTTPSGWTAIRRDAVASGNKATSWLYYRVAGSNEPAAYAWSIGSNWAAGVMGAWRGAAPAPIDKSSGATAVGSKLSLSAPSLTPGNNHELQVYFYGAQSGTAPSITLSSALSQRAYDRSSKEGFTLAFADLAAPSAGNGSSTYPATSGNAAMTAQAVLLVPGSGGGSTPTPTSTMTPTPTRTATPTSTGTTTSTATPAATATQRTTPTGTATPTALPTPTRTQIVTPTITVTATPTATATTGAGITFVGAGPLADYSAPVTMISVSLPSGIEAGDTMLSQIIVYDATASDAPTTPTGWTAIRDDTVGGGNKVTSWLYYKVAGSNEPASYSWSISSNWAAGVIGAWRGAAASPIDKASGATALGTTLVLSAPSLIPSNNGELQIYFYAAQSGTAPKVALSNALSQRFNERSSKEGFTLAFADLPAPSAGAGSPTYPANVSNAAATAQAILLVP